ncbi:MAG: phosphatase PAP2 family protein [Alphaproteobacteria bacterium]|nr:phosphatase PAP2 family protein [Alphaproteobacteria bacterium]
MAFLAPLVNVQPQLQGFAFRRRSPVKTWLTAPCGGARFHRRCEYSHSQLPFASPPPETSCTSSFHGIERAHRYSSEADIGSTERHVSRHSNMQAAAMTITIRRVLFAILGLLACTAYVWQQIRHFNVEATAFAALVAIFAVFAISAALYDWIRKDPCIGSMLFGLGFITIYGATLNVISYFGLTIAGPRIDDFLASVDRAMGVDWPALMTFMANHPASNLVMYYVYRASTWQTLIFIIILGRSDRARTVEQLCLTLVLCGILTIGTWILFPSFGAIAVYGLPPSIAGHLPIVVDQNYAHRLVNLLANGPGLISPLTIKGLVGFPSFHTAQAVIIAWYARRAGVLFYPFLIFNSLTILSTPIQGGHHVIDVIGGIAAAAFTIWLATIIANRVTITATRKEVVPALAAAS